MKNSINNLRNTLTSRETLTNQELFAIKGGEGEDLRRAASLLLPPPASPIAQVVVAVTTGK